MEKLLSWYSMWDTNIQTDRNKLIIGKVLNLKLLSFIIKGTFVLVDVANLKFSSHYTKENTDILIYAR